MIYRKSRRHKSRDTLRFVISCCFLRNIDSFQQIGFESKMYNDKNQTGYEQLRFKENKCRKISIQINIHILFIFWLYLMPKMAGKDLVNIEF